MAGEGCRLSALFYEDLELYKEVISEMKKNKDIP
jgi:hypothetical protein